MIYLITNINFYYVREFFLSMKKLIINILCFFILFNSFICTLSKSVHAIENYDETTKKSKSNEKLDKSKKTFTKEQINNGILFVTVTTGTIIFSKFIMKMCKQKENKKIELPKIDNKNIPLEEETNIEEEEEDIG